jgi:hypothetical protein
MTLAQVLQTFGTSYAIGGEMPIRVPFGRHDLARAFADLGFTTGAEVGVWKGHYSETLLKSNPGLSLLYCIDPWSPQPDYCEQKNDAIVLERAYQEAAQRLFGYFRSRAIRKPSIIAASDFTDGSLDFAYIDGNHRYGAVIQDLTAWAPKVRPGGIIAGHDFVMREKKHIEVEAAVHAYASTFEITPWFVLQSKADETPSWCWVKR